MGSGNIKQMITTMNECYLKVPDSCCMRREWIGGCRESPSESDTYMDV